MEKNKVETVDPVYVNSDINLDDSVGSFVNDIMGEDVTPQSQERAELLGDIQEDTENTIDNDKEQEYNQDSNEGGEEAKEVIEPNANVFEPPTHWPEEDKKLFSSLPAESQEVLLNQSKSLERGYQRKFQELAEDRRRTAAYEGLINSIERDPNLVKHILSYGEVREAQAKQEAQAQEENPYGLGPRPDDPLAAIEYDAAVKGARLAEKAIMDKLGPTMQQMTQRVDINSTMQKVREDELFPQVYKGMHEYVKSLPPHLAQEEFNRLNTDPKTFLNRYMWVRERLNGTQQQGNQPQASSPNPSVQSKAPRTETVREEAPVLESSGAGMRDVNGDVRKKLSSKDRLEKLRQGEYQPYFKHIVDTLGF